MRMKISYSACLLERTLNEHILLSILKTYDERGKSGLIKHFQSRDDHPKLIELMEGHSVIQYTRLAREKTWSKTSALPSEADGQGAVI